MKSTDVQVIKSKGKSNGEAHLYLPPLERVVKKCEKHIGSHEEHGLNMKLVELTEVCDCSECEDTINSFDSLNRYTKMSLLITNTQISLMSNDNIKHINMPPKIHT